MLCDYQFWDPFVMCSHIPFKPSISFIPKWSPQSPWISSLASQGSLLLEFSQFLCKLVINWVITKENLLRTITISRSAVNFFSKLVVCLLNSAQFFCIMYFMHSVYWASLLRNLYSQSSLFHRGQSYGKSRSQSSRFSNPPTDEISRSSAITG